MTAPVQVLDLSVAADAGAALRGFAIEHPRGGSSEGPGGYGLRLEGWALGARQPVAAIELVHGDDPLWRLALEVERPDVLERHGDLEAPARCGFAATIGTLALPIEFELELRAVLADETRVGLATVRGRREALRSQFEPRLQPLMITALGRTGSTIVTRLLAAHPQVVAYRPFEYEPRVASYWIDVLRELSEPASYRRQFSPAGSLKERGWWLAGASRQPPSIPEWELEQWLDARAPEQIAAFCQARIEALYARIAEQDRREGALYFAEKYRVQAMPGYVPTLMRELFAGAREVFLVRDFRDMVCSMLAFDRKRGFAGFGRPPGATDEQYVRGRLGEIVASFHEAWKSRAERSLLLRYEDLILHPTETLGRLLADLGLDADAATIAAMLEEVSGLGSDAEAHGTSATPAASVGRWRKDLPSELREACDTALGPALEAFGYPRAA